MKAVVIKVCGKHAVQLTQNGDFVKVKTAVITWVRC